jgi:hypothetical protein
MTFYFLQFFCNTISLKYFSFYIFFLPLDFPSIRSVYIFFLDVYNYFFSTLAYFFLGTLLASSKSMVVLKYAVEIIS